MSLFDDLRKEIAENRAVVVVGAGVSIQATGGAPCASWTGLLHDGARYCADYKPELKDKWLAKVEADIDSDDLDDLLAAAHKITAKLDGRADGEYRKWLHESAGKLKVRSKAVVEAIGALGAPIATTNYDGLLEDVTGLEPVTWRDHARVQAVIQGSDRAVLHLHGYWREPESVVLGIASYQDTLNDKHAQTVLHALSLMKTLIFVGCGAGLRDPNFGRLLKWRAEIMAGGEARSYRLALASEREELQKEHPPEQRIVVLSYGERHADLEGYLRKLAPAAEVSQPSAAAAAPSFLPPPRICFGRDIEVGALVANLLAPQPMPSPVLGAAGIGKSTVTIAALYHPDVVKRYGARRYFVRCDSARSRNELAAAIAAQFGIEPSPRAEAELLARLAEAPALLILDNLETPWEAEQAQVEDLLGALAAISTLGLVVSVRGNQRPGGVTWAEALRLFPLGPAAARQTFLSIAGRKFETDPLLDRLLDEVDRLPAAATYLAYAAEPDPDLSTVWQRWQGERTAMLRRGAGTDRLSNLELSYEISLQSPRVTADARRVLSALAVLPNGVAAAHLATVVPAGGFASVTPLRASGLAFDEAGRLRLLAPVRDYVARKYPPAAKDLRNASAFYSNLILKHGARVGERDGADAARLLVPDAGNIEEMLIRCSGAANPGSIAPMAWAWAQFAGITGIGSVKPIEHLAGLAKTSGDVFAYASCLDAFGRICLLRSEHSNARLHYEQALPLYRQAGSLGGEANCIQGLGDLARLRLHFDEAKERYQVASPLYRQAGNLVGEAHCIWSLGYIAQQQSEYEDAKKQYQEALHLYREVGNVLGEANCIWALGYLAQRRSEHDQAKARYQEAYPLYQQVGDVLGAANCLQGLGDVALAQSNREEAKAQFEQALALYSVSTEPYSVGNAHRRLARIAQGQECVQHVQVAREAFLKIDRPDLIKELDDEFGPAPRR